uniref:Retrotransposon Copia-like N-terminal domain-containing protein n=1 Tax=Cannabis sativa TaxID=3483 RepID=A0A803Q0K5_CANSA
MSTSQEQTSSPEPGNQGDQTPIGITSVPVAGIGQAPVASSNALAGSPFSNTLTQPFSLKLDRNIFPLWKTTVNTIIRGHRLEGFINGTRPPPPQFIPTGNSAVDTLGSVVENALEELYGAHSRANMDDIRTKIQTTRKGSQSMAEYLKMKRMWADSLALADLRDSMSYLPTTSLWEMRLQIFHTSHQDQETLTTQGAIKGKTLIETVAGEIRTILWWIQRKRSRWKRKWV